MDFKCLLPCTYTITLHNVSPYTYTTRTYGLQYTKIVAMMRRTAGYQVEGSEAMINQGIQYIASDCTL